MKNTKSSITAILPIAIICLLTGFKAQAQEYASPVQPPQTGRSPGVQVKLISKGGTTKTYALIFAAGDEVLSGLKEFAVKYKVKSAHFTGIGDAKTSRYGWYDQSRKMFKVSRIDEFAEITSLIGDIALKAGTPVVHAHINLATADGIVHGGHLLEAFVSPTLEVIVTVEPESLYKRLEPEFGIMVIDTKLQQ
ncbi:PPC domain-containing DNA-binding protein [Mucilaginibacter sp. CAU 1740]|uniref:PPC domain-containing DNA-binding protein n=1 Tax=Mucilaginibacter sp. CAU 1740 TaxID=3140365 RepID=UPI00325C0C95